MVVYHHLLIHLTRLNNLIVSKKPHTRDQSVISFGLTQMIDVVGVSHQEEQDTPLDRIFQSNLITQII